MKHEPASDRDAGKALLTGGGCAFVLYSIDTKAHRRFDTPIMVEDELKRMLNPYSRRDRKGEPKGMEQNDI
jgi:hypothetical protein